MVASVPELLKRTRSTPKRRLISSASATAVLDREGVAGAVRHAALERLGHDADASGPAASTPKAMSKSMYSLPSASQMREPRASVMNSGYGS